MASIFYIAGCEGCGNQKPLQEIELDKAEEALEVRFKRLDRDLFNADFSKPMAASQLLYQQYGSFWCHFIEGDIKLAPCTSDTVGPMLIPFVQDRNMAESNAEIQQVFTEEKLEPIKVQLTDMVQRWHHFFPDSLVPCVVFYQSAYNTNIAPVDSSLGIALDCYLGTDHRLTRQLDPVRFPAYTKQGMDAHYIVADAAKGWAAMQSRGYEDTKDFLRTLIFYGKMMYVAEALVPDQSDAQLMNWTSEQLAWAATNEWNIWKELANENVMFMTKQFEIKKWFDPGPFTNAQNIPQDSPPQLGVWIGWKMVRQYMEKFPDTTLQQLMATTDAQQVLAAYKPER
ncbi:MAG: hypothetical protein ACKVOR_13925 [Flavobacteriales bacterium]